MFLKAEYHLGCLSVGNFGEELVLPATQGKGGAFLE